MEIFKEKLILKNFSIRCIKTYNFCHFSTYSIRATQTHIMNITFERFQLAVDSAPKKHLEDKHYDRKNTIITLFWRRKG